MNCDKWRKLIEGLIDGRIGIAEEAELRAHAESCEECAVHLAQAVAFVETMSDGLTAARPSDELVDNLLETIREEPPPVAPVRLADRTGWKLATAASLLLSAGLLYMLNRSYRDAGTVSGRGRRPGTNRISEAPEVSVVGKLVRGQVEVRSDLRAGFKPLKSGSRLVSGTTLRVVGTGPAEVALADRVKVLLDAGSEVVFAPDAGRPFDICLIKGQTYADVVSGTPFTVYTEIGSVRSLGTRFGVSLANDKRAGEGMGVNVRKGVVRITSGGVAEKLSAGKCIFVGRRLTLRCSNGTVCGTSLAWISGPTRRIGPAIAASPAKPIAEPGQQPAPSQQPVTQAKPKAAGRPQATPVPARTRTSETQRPSQGTEEKARQERKGLEEQEVEAVRTNVRPSRRRGSGRRSRSSKGRSIGRSSSRSRGTSNGKSSSKSTSTSRSRKSQGSKGGGK
jgi:FecR protein/Putative zinc-finger